MRFLVGLTDPFEPHNPAPVRAFALGALLVAIEAGGATLGRTAALASLLADGLSYTLIANVECGYGSAADEAPPPDVLSLVLKVCQQLFSTVGVLASAQQEALLYRVHIALLCQKAIAHEKRLIVLEAMPCLFAAASLPIRLYASYDCSLRHRDVLSQLSAALADAARPSAGVTSIDSACLLALEALLDLLTASTADEAAHETSDDPSKECPLASAPGLLAMRESKQKVEEGVAAFNEKPKRGIKQLQASGVLKTPLDAAEVAAFMRNTPQIDKIPLGDFLSGPEVDKTHAALPALTCPHAHPSPP
jgi:hypothetical protein